jgi:hypothetical protein
MNLVGASRTRGMASSNGLWRQKRVETAISIGSIVMALVPFEV